jgi:rhodanese-related sulfurtransferase
MAECAIITPAGLRETLGQGGIILDVRTAMEHRDHHLACDHVHVPLDELSSETLAAKGVRADQTVYLLCLRGGRARQAAEKLQGFGYGNVVVIDGGITACAESGHAVNRAACKTMSLERQVRIAAGGIAAIGAALALWVDGGFAVIPLLVGLGLVNAGVTDCCPMATLIAKAPWNKSKSCCCK